MQHRKNEEMFTFYFEISFGFDVIVTSFRKSFYFSKTHSFTTIIINKNNTNTELFLCTLCTMNYEIIMQFFYDSPVKTRVFSAPKNRRTRFSFVFFADFRESSIEFGWESFLQNHFVPYNRVLFTPMNTQIWMQFLYASIFFSSFHTHFTVFFFWVVVSFAPYTLSTLFNTRLLNEGYKNRTQNIQLKNKIKTVCRALCVWMHR